MLEAIYADAGLPDGAYVNVYASNEQAAIIIADPRVHGVSVTGSERAGAAVAEVAGRNLKKVALELGGKNPNVVFGDVDLDVAVDHALTGAFLHSGQVCSTGARLLVDESIHDTFVERLVGRLDEIKLGDGFVANVKAGALISAEHRAKVEGYIDIAQREGARLVTGGGRPSAPELADGFYVEPTVFADCTSDMRVVQEEVFGPVLTVERFRGEDQAVELANNTVYGLAGAVWSGDAARGRRVAGRLRFGTVWINDFHPYIPQAEWGGVKQSGMGRELGELGLLEYTETKHVYENLRPGRSGWL